MVLDATHPLNDEEKELLAAVENRPAIAVLNKYDLVEPASPVPQISGIPVVSTSAAHWQKVFPLRDRILTLATSGELPLSRACWRNLRQHQVITTAIGRALARCRKGKAELGIPHEMILLDLYRVLWALDSRLPAKPLLTTS